MKKTLLFVLAAAFCVTLAAQPKSHRDLTTTGKAVPATKHVFGGNDDNVIFAPSQRPSDYFPAPDGKGSNLGAIGTSYYFLASNSNMRNTVNWSPDGSKCAATWTMGSSKKVRGTGINYCDPSGNPSWNKKPSVVDPFERIETGPTSWAPGWGTHVFTEQGECVVAHCTAAADEKGAIIINRRPVREQGEWIQSILQGPELTGGKTAILWPTMTAVGNTIHMFCVTEQDTLAPYPPTGTDMSPLYYRSTDGGETWEAPYDFIGVMPQEDMEAISADDYVITARGNHVVILYHCSYGLQVGYLESTDGGDTWTRKLVYDYPFDWESTGVGVGPAMSPTNSAVAIGDDGVVHVAFATLMIGRWPDNEPHYYRPFYAHWSGIFTWNSNQPTLTKEDFGIKYDFENSEWISLDYEDKPFFIYAPGLLGKADFDFSDEWATEMLVDNYDNRGFVEHPRLIAEGGKVYLMYSSVISEPMLHPANSRYVRGVFLTVSNDNGETFDQFEHTLWLSYGPELFYCDWTNFDVLNPFLTPPEVVMVSENGYPTMAPSIKNNKIAFTWLNDMFQFPEWPAHNISPEPWVANTFTVYSFMMDVNDIIDENWYMTKRVNDGADFPANPFIVEEQVFDNLQIYPNPATDNVLVKLGADVPFTMTVTNMMGQVVQTIQGKGAVNFNVSDYQGGIYIVHIKTAHATTSQKLIVK